MKQGQETNQIWTQEAGTDDTHNRTLTLCLWLKITHVFGLRKIACKSLTMLHYYQIPESFFISFFISLFIYLLTYCHGAHSRERRGTRRRGDTSK